MSGILFHENIPEFCAGFLLLSNNGINDIYQLSCGFADFPEIKESNISLAPSLLYKQALQLSKKGKLKFPRKNLFSLNFENSRENGNFLKEIFCIEPDPVFYPKSHHEKIEYIEFLKNWVDNA